MLYPLTLSSPKLTYYTTQDVLITLLNNLKVQERQDRVCTTAAIAIVADTYTITRSLHIIYPSSSHALSLTRPLFPQTHVFPHRMC